MTREQYEIEILNNQFEPLITKSEIALLNKTFEDFESRTCSNCAYWHIKVCTNSKKPIIY
jgi:hypothetical protein